MESSIASAFSRFRSSVSSAPSRTPYAERRLKWDLDVLVTGCIFEGQHRGWIKFYSQIDDLRQLHHLDAMIANEMATLRPSRTISVKRFVRTWHLINSHSLGHGYIPNLDLYSFDQMRQHLIDVGGWDRADAEGLSDLDARRVFNRRIRREVARLERDVLGRTS